MMRTLSTYAAVARRRRSIIVVETRIIERTRPWLAQHLGLQPALPRTVPDRAAHRACGSAGVARPAAPRRAAGPAHGAPPREAAAGAARPDRAAGTRARSQRTRLMRAPDVPGLAGPVGEALAPDG